eukprot:Platyproteum_vivax@DN6225_c0_g1_i4.p2
MENQKPPSAMKTLLKKFTLPQFPLFSNSRKEPDVSAVGYHRDSNTPEYLNTPMNDEIREDWRYFSATPSDWRFETKSSNSNSSLCKQEHQPTALEKIQMREESLRISHEIFETPTTELTVLEPPTTEIAVLEPPTMEPIGANAELVEPEPKPRLFENWTPPKKKKKKPKQFCGCYGI